MKPMKTSEPRFEPLSSMQFSCSDALEPYSCTKCDTNFPLKSKLLEHIKQGHSPLEIKPEIEYKCNKCNFTTFSKMILAKHDLNCEIIYPQPCSESVLTSPLEPDEEIVCDHPIRDIICSLLVEPFHRRKASERDDIIMYGRPTPHLSINPPQSNKDSDEEKEDNSLECLSEHFHTSLEGLGENFHTSLECLSENSHTSSEYLNDSALIARAVRDESEPSSASSDSECSQHSSNNDEEHIGTQVGPAYYIEHSWLCGSYYLQRAFCWPCLLFSDVKDEWSTEGVGEFHHLKYYTIVHVSSTEHLNNTEKLELARRELEISRTSSTFSIGDHNEVVLKNRFLGEIFVQAILVMKGGREYTVPAFEHLLELLLLLGEESRIRNHYNNIKDVFPGSVATFHDDIVACITSYAEDFILEEVKQAPFYTLRVDDAFLVTGNSQCAIIIRFVNSEGELVERFLGFHTVKETVESLYNTIDSVLGKLNYKKKLVGLSYDGGKPSLMIDLFVGKIREEARQAHFVYCIEHRFDLLLQQSLKNLSTLDFIWNCNQFRKLTSNLKRRIPDWPSKPDNIYKVVCDKWHSVKEALRNIDDGDLWYGDTPYHARSLLRDMETLYFAFFVCVFSEVFEAIRPLSKYLRQERICLEILLNQVRTCRSYIEKMRSEEAFQKFFEQAKSKSTFEKERRELHKRWYFETIDNVLLDLDMRFRDVVKLKFVALADSSKFEQYSKQFPLDLCKNVQRSYPEIFLDLNALICELEMFYQMETYHGRELENIVKGLNENKFHNTVFGEVYKLFCLILSLPLTKIRRKPYFKFIKTCAEYSTQDHLDEYVSTNQVQWEFVRKLTKTKNFYDDIIDLYATKDTRPVDLMFIK